jgi:digeranylgeranylglycerophospholipid reductase
MRYDVDVAIVGAGPAGSIAARELARKNFNVLVLEKRQEIGAPKRCAEGINIIGLHAVGLEPNPKWARQEIKGAILYSPKMREVTISGGNMCGYVVERKVFEKFLATDAIKSGAKYLVKTTVTDVLKEGGKVVGVKADYMGEEITVRSKLVIAADGVDSMTAKRAGINTVNKMTDYHSGFQYEMAGVDAEMGKLHLFFGNVIAPNGYIWIFPKGDTVANVGIGIVGARSEEGKRAKDLLDKFIKANPRFFGKASPIEVNGGGIPVAVQVKTFVGDGIMVVGDAAHQVNPIHGGGIAIAMKAAQLAAKVAAEALTEGDMSAKRLIEYDKEWFAGDGVRVNKLLKLRNFVEKLDDNELETLADIMSGDEILGLTSGNNMLMLKAIMTKAPKLLPLAKKFLD